MTVLEYAIIDKDLSVRLQYGYYKEIKRTYP